MPPLFKSQKASELPANLRWRVLKPAEGDQGVYVLAGDPISMHTHWSGRKTMPCPAHIEGCKVACPRCDKVLRFTCYVPCYTLLPPAGQRVVLMGAKLTDKSLTDLKVGDVMKCEREKKDRGTLLFHRHNPSCSSTQLNSIRKHCGADISPYLCHLWQWRELTEALGGLWIPSTETLNHESTSLASKIRKEKKAAKPGRARAASVTECA